MDKPCIITDNHKVLLNGTWIKGKDTHQEEVYQILIEPNHTIIADDCIIVGDDSE